MRGANLSLLIQTGRELSGGKASFFENITVRLYYRHFSPGPTPPRPTTSSSSLTNPPPVAEEGNLYQNIACADARGEENQINDFQYYCSRFPCITVAFLPSAGGAGGRGFGHFSTGNGPEVLIPATDKEDAGGEGGGKERALRYPISAGIESVHYRLENRFCLSRAKESFPRAEMDFAG